MKKTFLLWLCGFIFFLTTSGYGSEPPFGEFSTPINGSTVRSSVPFTGWALDDVEVVSVKIYRDVGGELSFVGDAVFVEGARPDVALFYPDYPNNNRAGWGYNCLTNFLPDGTHTFHAVAADGEGNEATLGIKTVLIDNANAVKPFGNIDTPEQGGTAQGAAYRVNGWVLTPQPNMIPTDSSTLNLFVDGVNLGHPNYNIYREDIATLFPGYSNSDGAHWYFDLDTTVYSNGIHTIYLTAEDDAGNRDGIGARFFAISSAQSLPAATTGAASGVGAGRATLYGTVNANGATTTVHFEYGLDANYGNNAEAGQSPVSGSTNTAVSANMSGLLPNTTYHYRVKATNAYGTANGADMTFATSTKSANTLPAVVLQLLDDPEPSGRQR